MAAIPLSDLCDLCRGIISYVASMTRKRRRKIRHRYQEPCNRFYSVTEMKKQADDGCHLCFVVWSSLKDNRGMKDQRRIYYRVWSSLKDQGRMYYRVTRLRKMFRDIWSLLIAPSRHGTLQPGLPCCIVMDDKLGKVSLLQR